MSQEAWESEQFRLEHLNTGAGGQINTTTTLSSKKHERFIIKDGKMMRHVDQDKTIPGANDHQQQYLYVNQDNSLQNRLVINSFFDLY